MAVTELDFANTVDAWVKQTEDRMLRVFKQSCQETVNIAQAAVPVDTGFLRSSVLAGKDGVPPIDPAKTNPSKRSVRTSGADVTATIAGLRLGDSFSFGYTAAYAAFVEYGTSRMSPRGFVAKAAGQWRATVESVVARAKARAGF